MSETLNSFGGSLKTLQIDGPVLHNLLRHTYVSFLFRWYLRYIRSSLYIALCIMSSSIVYCITAFVLEKVSLKV